MFFFRSQACPMEGLETQMQKGIKADYLEHPNQPALPLLKKTVHTIATQNFGLLWNHQYFMQRISKGIGNPLLVCLLSED